MNTILTEENTPNTLLEMGWELINDYYRSPKSKLAGPCTWVEYDPNGGCDAWSINGEQQIAPQETRHQLQCLMVGLGI